MQRIAEALNVSQRTISEATMSRAASSVDGFASKYTPVTGTLYSAS
jgi:hypothetical protein